MAKLYLILWNNTDHHVTRESFIYKTISLKLRFKLQKDKYPE